MGWPVVKLGDECQFENGKAHEQSIDEKGSFIVVNSKFISREGAVVKHTNDLKHPLNTNDIAMVMSDVPKGKALAKCFIVPENNKYSLNQRICSIKSSKFLTRFLYYQLNRHPYLLAFDNKGSQANLRKEQILSCPLFLPSMDEQQRIVAILDQAFTDIEKARANAEQNLKNARELFDSYLQQVFSQRGEGWTTRMMSDKSLLQMVDGDRGHNYPKKSDFKDEGHCLFLSTKNVRPDGFKFQDKVFISEERDNLLRKGRLKRNDVLITTRGTIGNLALFDDSVKYKNIRINSGMLILRPNISQILPSYLFEIMRSNIVKSQILAKTSGAAQPQLPIQTLNTFSFPVPRSLVEQKEMVLKLQELEKKASMLQAVYLHKLESLDELKKSLLQKAFSGELTKGEGRAA